MKSATKILSGLMVTALILPAAAGTASAATYHSDSDTSLGLLDYLENEHRAARAQKPNPEKEQLKADTEEMSKHLRYPIDPTKAAPVAFEGDDLTWNQVTGDFTAKGKVKVTQLDQHRFEGENVDGNTIDQRIHIPGKGHMLQFTPGQTEVMLDGFETNYNYHTRTGTMESAKGKVAENYMTGKKFEFYPDKIVVYDGTKTKCSAINPDYSLYARKIEIYPDDKMVMHNVRFKIKGMTFLSKSKYEVNLKKDTTVSDWFPRFGYDKTNGLWVRQNLKQPIAKHVDANAKIVYTTKKDWRNEFNVGWVNAGNYARVTQGYFDDSDDNWIKKQPSLLVGHTARIGNSPFHYSVNGEYGRWKQGEVKSNHKMYNVGLSYDPIRFEGWKLNLSTSYEVTHESYNDAHYSGFNYDATLTKDFDDRWSGYGAYRYQKNNRENSPFDFDNDTYSRKVEAGFSYRIDENNRVAFGSKYDVDNATWRKFDYYWFHDMHCSQVILHYEGRDKTWKVKWRFLPI